MLLKTCCLSLLLIMACNTPKGIEASPETMAKITFDLNEIDENGSTFPVTGPIKPF